MRPALIIVLVLVAIMAIFIAVRRRGSTTVSAIPHEQLPPQAVMFVSNRDAVRAIVRLREPPPSRWLIAYDVNPDTPRERGRITLIEGSMITDDLAFQENRGWTSAASVAEVRTVPGPAREDAYLVRFPIDPNGAMAHFVLATFADGSLDIKLSETTLRGKVVVLEAPYRVQVWSAMDNSTTSSYRVGEFTLPSPNATKLVKTGETTAGPSGKGD